MGVRSLLHEDEVKWNSSVSGNKAGFSRRVAEIWYGAFIREAF